MFEGKGELEVGRYVGKGVVGLTFYGASAVSE